MIKYIILGIIIVYSIFIIYKKIQNFKKGKFCDCNCDGCNNCAKESKK